MCLLLMELQAFINKVSIAHAKCYEVELMYTCNEYDEYLLDCEKDEYLKEIEDVLDIGLKYLLHAIFEEIQGEINCIELYESAIKNDCIIALYKLARLYDGSKGFVNDVNQSIYYYYKYYKATNNLGTFIDTVNIMHDNKIYETFIDTYCNIIDNRNELYEVCKVHIAKINKLQKRIMELEQRVTELEYMPNGDGYNKCKNHFETLVRVHSK